MNDASLSLPAPSRRFALSRVAAMMRRHFYLLRSSWPRLAELIYWPVVQMLVWGFLQKYLNGSTSVVALAGGALLGAVILWDVLVRGQLGLSVSFLEEMWSRNMANLLISPLQTSEFLLALMGMSLVRLVFGLVPMSLVAIALFGFNFWGLGFGLAVFFANLLLTGWAVGIIVAGLILRNGMGAEGLAWSLMALVAPLCAVYYPVSVLPALVQPFAWLLPPTYVFEGMRALMFQHTFRLDLMAEALAINAAFIALACLVFVRLVRSARDTGALMAIGE